MTKPTHYKTPTVASDWATSRNTDMIVAVAIHAIADSKRSAEQIWEEPTAAEYDNVKMAIENYISCGVFDADENNRYCWGNETVSL